MRSIKMISLAVVTVLALGAVTASGASAQEFVFSKTGKFTGKALNTQKLKTGGGATVECTKVAPGGEITKLKTTEQDFTLTPSSCSVLAIGEAGVTLLDITLFTSTFPFVSWLTETPIIHAKALGIECEIELKAGQSLGGSASEGEYVNKSGKLEVKQKLTKIASKVLKSNSESLCGKTGAESGTGTYEGNIEIEIEGGTIEVK